MNLNLFTRPPYRWWQFKKNFLYILGTIKCMRQRITKGYCFRDVWNLGDFYITLFSNSIKDLADTTNSFPLDFRYYQDWINYLNIMSTHFKKAQEINDEIYNIETKEAPDEENQSMSDFYKTKRKRKSQELEDGLNMLKDRIEDLWD